MHFHVRLRRCTVHAGALQQYRPVMLVEGKARMNASRSDVTHKIIHNFVEIWRWIIGHLEAPLHPQQGNVLKRMTDCAFEGE
jgi:hypothetical protein